MQVGLGALATHSARPVRLLRGECGLIAFDENRLRGEPAGDHFGDDCGIGHVAQGCQASGPPLPRERPQHPTACIRPANWAAANQVCAQGLDRRSRSTFVAGRRANRFASLLFWCFAGCSPQQRPGAVRACMRTDVLSAACTSNMTSCRFDTDLCLQICFVLADSRF